MMFRMTRDMNMYVVTSLHAVDTEGTGVKNVDLVRPTIFFARLY